MRIATTPPPSANSPSTLNLRHNIRSLFAAAAILLGSLIAAPLQAQVAGTYTVTNLVSDGSVPATFTDSQFINPWAASATGTWWISTAGTGLNFVIPSALTAGVSFKVVVPNASGAVTAIGSPAGSVGTGGGTAGLLLPAPNSTRASFLFSTLDGTIAGWNSKVGTTTGTVVPTLINNSAAGASYPDITIYNTATTTIILACNFGAGRAIEVYDSNFARTTLAGSFTDPNLPANYAPFSIHIINGKIYVAYTSRSATAPYIPGGGPGVGILDVFDTTGVFLSRAITGGSLNAPWGVAIAPTNFGIFGGALLVGNFGDGRINAYDATTFAFKGQLADGTGKPLTYASLWELLPAGTTPSNSTTGSGGLADNVYFTAGLASEAHGLFARIASVATPAGTANFGFASGDKALTIPVGTSGQTIISVAPTNGFSGTVTLACSGLPANSTCLFTPASITASATAPATSTLIITTTRGSARLTPFLHGAHSTAITTALLLPFASILAFYRRRSPLPTSPLRLLSVLGIMLVTFGMIAGCSSNPTPIAPTPTGTSQVTVTATSGAVTQTTVIAVTVQ